MSEGWYLIQKMHAVRLRTDWRKLDGIFFQCDAILALCMDWFGPLLKTGQKIQHCGCQTQSKRQFDTFKDAIACPFYQMDIDIANNDGMMGFLRVCPNASKKSEIHPQSLFHLPTTDACQVLWDCCWRTAASHNCYICLFVRYVGHHTGNYG